MKKLLPALRIIAVLSFFAPWATCSQNWTGTTETVSFGHDLLSHSTDSITKKDSANTIASDSTRPVKDDSWDYSIFYPTENSMSGIGILFFNLENPVYFTLDAAVLITIFLLFNWRFLRFKFRRGYFLLLNLLCIIAFTITFAIREKEHILWGLWVYIICVLLQFIIALRQRRSSV